ncbi:hypothetical protein SAMN05444410_10839 [Hydrobacter penzbergensis]|uniref:KAP family P-loop domain-containing protein n=1 Tax=Hydrobacter penzbergensis TaxID=1235997 RepID=A0A8X8ICW4_9BACT|nr:hypothetical protein [Hydrobacter penzbergensis]SDX01515.1 hypothetical protein SAMN05444410_10839 [Hydrobacter penzbergensis]
MNITNIITDYVSSVDISGAIMINGPWGIGKSHYWRNQIVPKIEAIAVPNKQRNFKCLYVSLNGIDDIEELMTQLTLEKLPSSTIGSLIKSKALGTVKLTAQAMNKEKLYQSVVKFITEEVDNFSYNVICFDDFERNKIQENILGYINTNFVERKNIKVVIIGNEAEIEPSLPYFKIKEKLIFRTLQFDQAIVPIADIFKVYNADASFYKLLLAQESYIKNILDKYRQQNLRTLIFSLHCLKRLFNAYPTIENEENEELAKSLFLFTFLISFEFKSGKLITNDYLDWKNLDKLLQTDYAILLSLKTRRSSIDPSETKKQKSEEQDSYEFDFYQKYSIWENKEYYFFPSAYSLVLSGDFQSESFIKEISDFKEFVQQRDGSSSPQKEALNALQYNFNLKTDEELKRHYAEFMQFAEAGNYFFTDYPFLLDLAGLLIDQELIDADISQIKQKMLAGCSVASRKHIDPSFLPQFEFQSKQREQEKQKADPDLMKIINAKIEELRSELNAKNKNRYLEIILEDSDAFKNTFRDVIPFQHATEADILNVLSESPIANQHFLEILVDHIRFFDLTSSTKYKESYQELLRLLSGVHPSMASGLIKSRMGNIIRQLKKILELIQASVS